MAAGNGRSGPQLTWAGLATGGLLLVAITVAVGSLIQSQLGALDRRIDQERGDRKEAATAVHDTLQQELDRRFAVHTADLASIHAELDRRRGEFVQVDAFREFKSMVDWYMRTPFMKSDTWSEWKGERDRRLEQIDKRLDTIELGIKTERQAK